MNLQKSFIIQPGGFLQGSLSLPGDKSISHRALMLGAIAEGKTTVNNFLVSSDCLATQKALENMGVQIEQTSDEKILIHGVGLWGLRKPSLALQLENSGTSIRLLAGLLAGQKFSSQLTGDDSLRQRPMQRVVDPLRKMGANIEMSDSEFAPLTIHGQQKLKGVQYQLPIASAQVKSALLLAGLYAEGETILIDPVGTRDHTERMLSAFGCDVERQKSIIRLRDGQKIKATSITIPRDFSSAAFFIVGATIASGSHIILEQVGINPTRLGLIAILRQMGADIELRNNQMFGNEPVADIHVRSSSLKGMAISPDLVPLAIDEFPIIFIAAACAKGITFLRGAQELRVKESDRIRSMVHGLKVLGIDAEEISDGLMITGSTLRGGRVSSYGDHRVAMAFSIAALRAKDEIIVDNCANVATSFPGFVSLAQQAGLRIEGHF